jgi:PhnB protein
MPSITPYLHFAGNCREAFAHYQQVFGGEFGQVSTFGEIPPQVGQPPMDSVEAHKLMHISLPIGPTMLFGSDQPSWDTEPLNHGNTHSLSLSVESRAEADRLFAGLAEGGTITMPIQDTFWNAYFGMLKDAFGVQWMISYDLPAA